MKENHCVAEYKCYTPNHSACKFGEQAEGQIKGYCKYIVNNGDCSNKEAQKNAEAKQ